MRSVIINFIRIQIPLAGVLLSGSFASDLRLPAIISDNAVLCQNKKAVIWGWAPAESEVSVTVIDSRKDNASVFFNVTTGQDGKWRAEFEPFDAGGPYTVSVKSGSKSISVENVYFGEVWIGSGQSNMHFSLGDSDEKEFVTSRIGRCRIHYFKVLLSEHEKPQDDLRGEWVVADAKNIENLSAVLAFAGIGLSEALNVPVGFIQSAMGGIPADLFTPADFLSAHKNLSYYIDDYYSLSERERRFLFPEAAEFEIRNLKLKDSKGTELPLSLTDLQDAAGVTVRPDEKTAHYSGVVSFENREGIIIPVGKIKLGGYSSISFEYKSTHPLRLKIKTSESPEWASYSSEKRNESSRWTEAELAFNKCRQPEWYTNKKPLNLSLAESFSVYINPYKDRTSVPGGMYNAMIQPLSPLPVSGVFWYQGEGNADKAKEYEFLLKALIKGWRNYRNEDTPFIVVQLPNFRSLQTAPVQVNDKWARLRESQLKVLELTNTAMVITIDAGDPDDIHPVNKKPVGERMALTALNLVYGKKTTGTGPILNKYTFKDAECTLTFKNADNGLKVAEGPELTGFAMAGEDKVFYWAKAKITGNNSVSVKCRNVKNPVSVRYSWADNPVGNLVNNNGLPASPFRTDSWP
ncbi:MAG TPA: sialate O-acetylesterase [Pontiella sp.]